MSSGLCDRPCRLRGMWRSAVWGVWELGRSALLYLHLFVIACISPPFLLHFCSQINSIADQVFLGRSL
ncbi:hypothetical protein QUA00_32385 [Microcoleus sp. T2B6]|uniref:hypothetical protein n=1 Tax=Microcoleus sp. T2B6 TaxID=3055424 RepID=UPI002FD208AC